MLLMNRRGYNSFVSCRSCGYVVKCPNCDVAMTYHVAGSGQTEAELHCHYCGYAALPPSTCPKCGSKHLDKLQRITGYLVGTTDRWNNAKLSELNDRVTHN